MTITLLCPTRWTVRAKSLRSIIDNFETLQILWDWSLDNCDDTEMKARIRGVDANMQTFEYVFGSYLGELILGHSDNLSRSLQNPDLSAVDGRAIALSTVKTLKTLRHDGKFDLFWEKVTTHQKRLQAGEPKLPRNRRQPKTMTDYFGYGNGAETMYTCPKDYYRKQYYEAVDAAINCIEDRFDQEDFQMYGLLEQVLLRAAKGESYEDELTKVIEFYHDDLDEFVLKSQLQTFSANYESDGIVSFASIRKYLQSLSPAMKSLLSQVFRLAKLVLVLLRRMPQVSAHLAQCVERNPTCKTLWGSND